jgi:2-polyprenyl-6-methoxyphenol hydroxylase-like FAD-dependent oxidoreductase
VQVLCVGGGPAGLFLAIALKRADPGHDVTVVERRARDGQPGWGIVFWGSLVEQLERIDPVTADEVRACARLWNGQRLRREGATVERAGRGFAIGRQRLLRILTERAEALSVDLRFGEAADVDGFRARADVVALCDGANSVWRTDHADAFATTVREGGNRYVWLGTDAPLEKFTFAYRRTGAGWIWFHGYQFDDRTSTCIIECTAETWRRLGLGELASAPALEQLEAVFADDLPGGRLLAGPDDGAELPWWTFRTVTNERWFNCNTVLVGDAAHTTHFSIGSGTQLAFEDALALARSIDARGPGEPAFAQYQADRQRAVVRMQEDAARSERWFEDVDRYASLKPEPFFTLLHARRHAVPSWMSPAWYARLYAVAERVTGRKDA